MKIVSSEQMRVLDNKAISEGTAGIELMERAGTGLVRVLQKEITDIVKKKVVVFVGKGNNGGDGLVVARKLKGLGAQVRVILLAEEEEMREDTKTNLTRARGADIDIIPLKDLSTEKIKEEIFRSDIIVDAIFGTGFSGVIGDMAKDTIEAINNSKKYVVACDIPSGVNGNTGEVGGPCVDSDLTVTFAYPKKGLFLYPGYRFVGNIRAVDIGIKDEDSPSRWNMLTSSEIKEILPKRRKDAHKKNFGHVLILAGSFGMTGAATLACQGALKVGAGLVTLGIPESLNTIMEVKITEAMTLPLPETEEKSLRAKGVGEILDFIERRKVDVIVIGPGLSTNRSTGKLVKKILKKVDVPCILDADGINLLVSEASLAKAKAKIIITPHPGELGRLLGKKAEEIQRERIRYAFQFSEENNLVCVLKGYQTVVTKGEDVFINPLGNPGMASGGSGDVLSGMIGGLVGQLRLLETGKKNSLLSAAICGVYLHSLAGDLARREKGEMSLIASDIVEKIPGAVREVLEN
ncbi:MAG: NAD(P)H-hydrate dehydratase [bacterium]